VTIDALFGADIEQKLAHLRPKQAGLPPQPKRNLELSKVSLESCLASNGVQILGNLDATFSGDQQST
jgi:hypothetical protein